MSVVFPDPAWPTSATVRVRCVVTATAMSTSILWSVP